MNVYHTFWARNENGSYSTGTGIVTGETGSSRGQYRFFVDHKHFSQFLEDAGAERIPSPEESKGDVFLYPTA